MLETLETRRLMAVTADLGGGVLTVDGTAGADEIFVYVDETAPGGPRVVVEDYTPMGSTYHTFKLDKVNEIRIYGHDGFDGIYVTNEITLPTRLEGGADQDWIEGGEGPNTIYGGGGNDTCVGGNGNDMIYGQGGDDQISGVGGHDWLWGGGGNDYLNGGSGVDRLYGEDGNDYLDADDGLHLDLLWGGNGIDTAEIDVLAWGGPLLMDGHTGVEALVW